MTKKHSFMAKKRLFLSDHKILIFTEIWTKKVSLKWSKNVLFLEIFIFWQIWTRNYFLKVSQKTCFSSKCCYFGNMNKKRFSIRSQNKIFFWNVDIFGHMGKKNRSEKNTLTQTLIFSEIWAKKDFYKVISKNVIILEM